MEKLKPRGKRTACPNCESEDVEGTLHNNRYECYCKNCGIFFGIEKVRDNEYYVFKYAGSDVSNFDSSKIEIAIDLIINRTLSISTSDWFMKLRVALLDQIKDFTDDMYQYALCYALEKYILFRKSWKL
jgi:hypothetical protein